MSANLKDLMISFDKVDKNVIEHFEVATDELIEKYGNKEAMCRALALITGFHGIIKERSLLTGREGYVTFLLLCDRYVKNEYFVKEILRNDFSDALLSQIRDIKVL